MGPELLAVVSNRGPRGLRTDPGAVGNGLQFSSCMPLAHAVERVVLARSRPIGDPAGEGPTLAEIRYAYRQTTQPCQGRRRQSFDAMQVVSGFNVLRQAPKPDWWLWTPKTQIS